MAVGASSTLSSPLSALVVPTGEAPEVAVVVVRTDQIRRVPVDERQAEACLVDDLDRWSK